jgi:protein phosphatase
VCPTNQDAFAAINSRQVWIVADGMGGHPSGDLAAQTAVQIVTQQAREHTEEPSGPLLSDLIEAANHAVHEKTRADPSLTGMGTTVVTMTISLEPAPVAHIAHLGDSRAYLLHAGTLKRLTRDHTVVERFVQRGLIDAEAAKTHPKRHVLTKGLGMGLEMTPDITSIALAGDDLIVLCSDGLTKMLEDGDIAAILRRAKGKPRRACDDLVEQALLRGGEDNVTVIVCAHTTSPKSGSLAIDKISPAM